MSAESIPAKEAGARIEAAILAAGRSLNRRIDEIGWDPNRIMAVTQREIGAVSAWECDRLGEALQVHPGYLKGTHNFDGTPARDGKVVGPPDLYTDGDELFFERLVSALDELGDVESPRVARSLLARTFQEAFKRDIHPENLEKVIEGKKQRVSIPWFRALVGQLEQIAWSKKAAGKHDFASLLLGASRPEADEESAGPGQNGTATEEARPSAISAEEEPPPRESEEESSAPPSTEEEEKAPEESFSPRDPEVQMNDEFKPTREDKREDKREFFRKLELLWSTGIPGSKFGGLVERSKMFFSNAKVLNVRLTPDMLDTLEKKLRLPPGWFLDRRAEIPPGWTPPEEITGVPPARASEEEPRSVGATPDEEPAPPPAKVEEEKEAEETRAPEPQAALSELPRAESDIEVVEVLRKIGAEGRESFFRLLETAKGLEEEERALLSKLLARMLET